jgi:hypothetical protein
VGNRPEGLLGNVEEEEDNQLPFTRACNNIVGFDYIFTSQFSLVGNKADWKVDVVMQSVGSEILRVF